MNSKYIDDIMNFLPHRYPFLLVDRVIDLGEDWIKTLKNVSYNEPFFQGHFPFYPIMPGVLIIEAMAQSAGILLGNSNNPKKMLFMGIDKARFRSEVRPGEQLVIEIKITQNRGNKIIKFEGKAYVEGKIVTEANMLAGLGE